MDKGKFEFVMKNGLGWNGDAGLKPLAQSMEALRADERVGFNRLSRTEAGTLRSPADSGDEKRSRAGLKTTVSTRLFCIYCLPLLFRPDLGYQIDCGPSNK